MIKGTEFNYGWAYKCSLCNKVCVCTIPEIYQQVTKCPTCNGELITATHEEAKKLQMFTRDTYMDRKDKMNELLRKVDDDTK
jgi:hypothetical protein